MTVWSFQHIRSRLTAWHIIVFGGILLLYAAGTFGYLFFNLNRQLDEGLKEDIEILEQLLVQAPEGSYFNDQHGDTADRFERFLEIWSDDGRLLYRSRLLGNRSLGDLPPPDERDRTVRIYSLGLPDGSHWRVATTVCALHAKPVLIRLAVSEGEFYGDIRNFGTVLFLGIPVGLLLVAVSGYMLSRAALRPSDAMAAMASRIGAQNLKDRIPVKNPNDELGRLAIAFNDLLARVELSFDKLNRFASDASHELRSPLTAMRSVGEVSLHGEHSLPEYREVIGSMLEESQRLTRLIDSLLLLSRADVGRLETDPEEFDLYAFAQEIIGLVAVLAEEKEQVLSLEGQMGVMIRADRSMLRQALLYLLDNAIKFSPHGGTVSIKVGKYVDGFTILEVVDHGPGIPSAEQARIFERFHRTEKGREYGGAGLGLAIVRWAVEANGGRVTVQSSEGVGSTFSIMLRSNLKTA